MPADRPRPPRSSRDDEPTIEWLLPDLQPEAVPAPPRPPAPSSRADRKIEVEVRSMSLDVARRFPRVYEIWTKNRVYSLDVNLICIEVTDLASGETEAHHPFLGAHLAGGQRESGGETELSLPLPVPGSAAVFQKVLSKNRIQLSLTSSVTRVILHVQRAKIPAAEKDKAWGTITHTEQ